MRAAWDALERNDFRAAAQAARLLRDLEIDIAVDLKGHTAYSRVSILAHRPSPVHATYMGYPGPVAASFLDYVIADRVVIPPAEQRFYQQKVISLPESYWVNDATLAIAERTPPRAELGLPELVTQNLSDYEALARKLAADKPLLRQIREKLARNRLTYPLFDSTRSARHFEAAYREMLRDKLGR